MPGKCAQCWKETANYCPCKKLTVCGDACLTKLWDSHRNDHAIAVAKHASSQSTAQQLARKSRRENTISRQPPKALPISSMHSEDSIRPPMPELKPLSQGFFRSPAIDQELEGFPHSKFDDEEMEVDVSLRRFKPQFSGKISYFFEKLYDYFAFIGEKSVGGAVTNRETLFGEPQEKKDDEIEIIDAATHSRVAAEIGNLGKKVETAIRRFSNKGGKKPSEKYEKTLHVAFNYIFDYLVSYMLRGGDPDYQDLLQTRYGYSILRSDKKKDFIEQNEAVQMLKIVYKNVTAGTQEREERKTSRGSLLEYAKTWGSAADDYFKSTKQRRF